MSRIFLVFRSLFYLLAIAFFDSTSPFLTRCSKCHYQGIDLPHFRDYFCSLE